MLLGELFVGRVAKFVVMINVDPKLKVLVLLFHTGANLSVYNSLSSVHPLALTRTNFAFVPQEIFVTHPAFDNIGNCLETSMWVV